VIVRYQDEAVADYQAAAAWHDEQSPDMGDEFARAIEQAEQFIADTPRTWPQWPGAPDGVRRYLLPGLLYSIAYELLRDEVVIIAIAHQRRRPNFWFGRTTR
jgi:plasmid stabilization system protein ParE